MDKDISLLTVKYEINPDLRIGTFIKFKKQSDDLSKKSVTFYGVISEVKNDFIKVLLIKDNHNFILYDNDYIDISAKEIVNGYIVLDVGEDLKTGERQLEMSMDYPNDSTIYDSNDIKEVSIHEQYEQNSYKTNI